MDTEIVKFLKFPLKILDVVVSPVCELWEVALLPGDIVEYLKVQRLAQNEVAPRGIYCAKELLIEVVPLTLYSPNHCVASDTRAGMLLVLMTHNLSNLSSVANNATIDDKLGSCIEGLQRVYSHWHYVLQDRVFRSLRFALEYSI